ncbi:unnamed protein product, partial [Thlaspi arvense]
MESNPWTVTPGSSSSHGTKTGLVGKRTVEKLQCELDLSSLGMFDEEPHDPIDKSFHETGTPVGENKRKRGRDDDIDLLKTPPQRQKRKKIRGKVSGDVNTNKPSSKSAVKKASATAKTSVRPKRSTRRCLTFDIDAQVEDIFGSIPKRKRRSRTKSMEKPLVEFPKIQRKRRSILVQRCRYPLLKAIISKMQSGVSRKKRSNRDPIASKLNARVLRLQWRRLNLTGTSHEELWKQKSSIDFITELIEELDITRDRLSLPHNRETALVLHQKTCQQQKSAVQYKRDGSIVPFPSEKNHQTKVELDEETKRVWKLLMVSIDSEGIDGLDEDKKKWWEEERKEIHARASSFIARMRLVQGDRRFSPWKGSVVDSVVGVFLTQNVADHSSSSVFMDIAAEFPMIFNSNEGPCLEEWNEIAMNLDPRYGATTHGSCNPTIIIDEIDDDDDIDAICSQEASTSSEKSISSTNQLNKVMPEPLTSKCEATFDYFRNNVRIQDQDIVSHQQEGSNSRSDQHVRKNKKKPRTLRPKGPSAKNKPKESFDWDSLRRQAQSGGQKRRTERTMDIVDWDALRCTSVKKIGAIIRKRGMHEMLSHRIKAFLNRLVQDHEAIDLEWLRDVSPDKAKEYLMSIHGLGLKSVECVRLLSLHQTAFPVDTNVGRIVVRLGWVPLQPLPDELQMHLLELYELQYHMITFGKVFCTKVKPNCKACPMKAECRHYASARASALRDLPESEEEGTVVIHERRRKPKPVTVNFRQCLFLGEDKEREESKRLHGCEPIIEEPTSPETVCADIEDFPDPWENKDAIPTIILNKEAAMSKDLVLIGNQASSLHPIKLKFIENLRTEHCVYELPDSHPILKGFEKRELKDRVPYLLAIWMSGETASSIKPPKRICVSQGSNTLCHEKTCFSCNNIREENSQVVRGTILIPCRTAMRGGFPLNGTYFQTNEVFADHRSSINPIRVSRASIGNLRRGIVYFGSSVSACFGGIFPKQVSAYDNKVDNIQVEAIQYGFWAGYVCVRGFDRKNRKSKTLARRLHCPPSNKKKDDHE